jgi:U3 small nucleolar RNA-associated protein 10
VLWKPINAAVCLLSRDARPRVRLAAVLALREIFARGRDDALVLIPETLPFLSELAQDDDQDVDGCTASFILAL